MISAVAQSDVQQESRSRNRLALLEVAASSQGLWEMPGRVLVVDDDPDAQEILARIVTTLGLDVQTASDGLEALDALEQPEATVLVLLDLLMPGMDGFDVLARLRSSPATRHIPVIVVTACSRDQISMVKLPGVKDVVLKGHYTPTGLSELITNTLGSTSALAGSA